MQDGAEARWLKKKVLDSKVLDSMEDLSTWSFQGDGDMALADSPVKDGKHSLRIRSIQNIGKVGGAGEWEDLIASRKFGGEDWSHYNRISIWVYPDVIGAPAISASLVLHNQGAHVLPDRYNEGRHESIILKNHRMESRGVGDCAAGRDKVTETRVCLQPAENVAGPGGPNDFVYRSIGIANSGCGSRGGMGCCGGKNCVQPRGIHHGRDEERDRDGFEGARNFRWSMKEPAKLC